MKKSLIILILFISFKSFSQIWDFPPEPSTLYEPNTTINRKNVKTIKRYNITIENGKRTNDKILTSEHFIDSNGRTVYYIENGQKTFVDQKSNSKMESNIIYDSIGRPTKQTVGNKIMNWKYKGDKLSEYFISNSNNITEKRIYEYKDSKLIYTICYPNDSNNKNCDTIIANMNYENKPTKINAIKYYGDTRLTPEMNFKYDERGNMIEGNYECEHYEFQYNINNYRTKLLRYDCKGILVEELEYDYEFY
jgi:hypothetical protein